MSSDYGITISQEELVVSSVMSRMSVGSDADNLSTNSAKITPSISSSSIQESADELSYNTSVSSVRFYYLL